MDADRERNSRGQYTDHIPATAALEVFEEREDYARPVTADEVMEALDCSRRTAHNKLNELVEEDRLETRKIGARARVWWIPIPAEGETPTPIGVDDRSSSDDASENPRSIDRAIRRADLPGSGGTLEARRDALRAAYSYLTNHPSATKSDFVDNVYPEYPAGFETEEGWWNAIQPALKELPGVDPPEERGHLWKFLGRDRFTPTLG